MHIVQLPLLYGEPRVRSWCGHYWLVIAWYRWDHEYCGETLIEKLEVK